MAVIGIDGRALDVERTGIGRYLENLLREWAHGAHTHELRVYGMTAQSLAVAHRVVRFETADQPDLFAAELARAPIDVFFSPLYELADSVTGPAVITVHDLVHEAAPEAFTPLQRDWLRARHAACLPRATTIITDSRFARDEIAARFPDVAGRLSVIPLAADPRFTPAVDASVRAADTARVRTALPELAFPYLLYVGAVSRKRHIPQLVEALTQSEGLAQTSLCLIGRDYHVEPGTLARVIDAAPPGRIVHRPHVSNELLVSLYRQARGFVYLSTYEGFGMPPLEAMACGAPVVIADAASLPEVVGDAALRVADPADLTQVRAALEALLDDDRAADLRAAGVRRASAFSWTATAAATLDVIERAAREKGC